MALWLAGNAVLLVVAYFLGSIPPGYLAGQLLKGIDIREHGSGSTGATNVLRTLGKGPAIAVLLIDILKGVSAIVLVRWCYSLAITQDLATEAGTLAGGAALDWMVTLAGLAAILGHSKSVWLNFTGGKSVATGLGVLLALSWQVGLSTFAVFGVVMAVSRIVSLSSITAAIAVFVFMLLLGQPLPYQLFAIAGGLYVVLRHRTNIQRLLAGTEPRIGQKLSQEPEQSLESSP
uniref:glycerol-3-phosphate 1-O-acyltransferase PlsY n=1 Tax=Trichocoleus desertorum TaxID=1481672 RepID=UPI0025B4F767|nr:glycerol-3-phosphate 1-O-acyltransferase PlsY [Trichocoleus desertorum]